MCVDARLTGEVRAVQGAISHAGSDHCAVDGRRLGAGDRALPSHGIACHHYSWYASSSSLSTIGHRAPSCTKPTHISPSLPCAFLCSGREGRATQSPPTCHVLLKMTALCALHVSIGCGAATQHVMRQRGQICKHVLDVQTVLLNQDVCPYH